MIQLYGAIFEKSDRSPEYLVICKKIKNLVLTVISRKARPRNLMLNKTKTNIMKDHNYFIYIVQTKIKQFYISELQTIYNVGFMNMNMDLFRVLQKNIIAII